MPIIDPKKTKIVIEITEEGKRGKRASQAAENEPQPLGMLPTPFLPSPVIRRKKPGGILLNFYDLGRLKVNGTFTDLPFTYVPEIPLAFNPQYSVITPYGDVSLDLPVWKALENKIFEIPLADFKDKYKKVDYDNAGLYGIDIVLGDDNLPENHYVVAKTGDRGRLDNPFTPSGSYDYWTETGLKIPKGKKVKVFTGAGFIGFNIDFPIKTTLSRDFEAEGVPLAFNRDSDIFLMPYLMFELGTDDQSGGINRISYLNMLYTLGNRDLLLDCPEVFAFWQDYVNTTSRLNQFNFNFSGFEIPGIYNRLRALFINRPESRYYVFQEGQAPGYESPVNFPSPITRGRNFTFLGDINYNGLTAKVNVFPGVLLAIVKQGDSFFYVWANDTVEVVKGSSYYYSDYIGS